MTHHVSRRTFVKSSAVATAALAGLSTRRAAANDRIRIGVIGTGNRGGQLMEALAPHGDAEITALCDVYQPHLDKWNEAYPNAKHFRDYRDMYADGGFDAVVIATPDHWHALQTIEACEAGYDVFVEKPMSYTIYEGRQMVEAARRTNRVVQVGLQRRSSLVYEEVEKVIASGALGHITSARSYRLSNMFPSGMGRAKTTTPPPDLDWEMWVGPRPWQDYQDNIAPYKFRWWSAYSSQMTNWGVHYFDLIRRMLGEEAIAYCCALGGRFAVDDDRTIPDTMEATFQFPGGSLMLFGQHEASGNPLLRVGEVEFRGTQGTLYGTSRGFEIIPERGGQFQDREPRMEPAKVSVETGGNADDTVRHMRNWLDCIRSRELPVGDVEIGHRSTTIALLGNISLESRCMVAWDAENERITNIEELNEKLHYEYRKPWTLG